MEPKHRPKSIYERYSHYTEFRQAKKNRLLIAIIITFLMMVCEFFGGLFTKSLALMSDSAHMFTHLFALLISWTAIIFAERPATKYKTYGFYRLEILAALINGITLIIISGAIFYSSYRKILSPVKIDLFEMLVIATAGFIVNLVTVIIIEGISKKDINIHSAFLHLLGDTFSSVVIIIGAVIIHFTKLYIVDPILASLIAILILIWSYKLIKDSTNILLEATPAKIELNNVINAIKNIKGVINIHDVHIWEITSRMYILSAHIIVKDCSVSKTEKILNRINTMLDKDFDITHTTIQFECSVS